MGLEGNFIIELKKKIAFGKDLLTDNYDILSAIYRHDHAGNQLEIMWDGRSHMEAYEEMYTAWIKQLSYIKEIQRPIIKYAVLEGGVNPHVPETIYPEGILGHFDLRMRYQMLYRMKSRLVLQLTHLTEFLLTRWVLFGWAFMTKV